MRACVFTTGAVFGLLVVAHVWRILAEGRRLAREPDLIVITPVAAASSLWAFELLKR